MRGNGTACAGNEHLFKADCLNLLDTAVNDIHIAACVSNEDSALFNFRAVSDSVLDVLWKHVGKITAVLFANPHFRILYRNAGLELKQVCAESFERGATSALLEKFKIIYDKRSINLIGKSLTRLGDILGGITLCRHICSHENKQSTARGKVLRVNHVHAVKIL